MSLVAIVRLLSLHATTQLVAAGYTAPFALGTTPTIAITNVTNATPMVVTCASEHGIRPGLPLHVVITGVLGTTAANRLNADGVTNDAWHAVATTDTAFALYTVDEASGALVASVGNGAYVSGGTVSKAFTDGRILMGSENLRDPSYPPRVVMYPIEDAFGPKAAASRANAAAATELARERQQRSIATDQVHFQIHAWASETLPLGLDDVAIEAWQQTRDPDLDFDAARVLFHQIKRSAHAILGGIHDPKNVRWIDQSESETQKLKAGHEVVFTLAVDTPVLGTLLPRAPADVAAQTTTQLVIAGGAPETGCSEG